MRRATLLWVDLQHDAATRGLRQRGSQFSYKMFLKRVRSNGTSLNTSYEPPNNGHCYGAREGRQNSRTTDHSAVEIRRRIF